MATGNPNFNFDWRDKIFNSIIFILLFIALLAFLFTFISCNTSNHNKKSIIRSVDSTNVIKRDSTSIIKNRTSAISTNDSSVKLNDISYSDNGIGIHFFADSNNSNNDKPVTIDTTGGKIVINPGGRKVKDINLNHQKSESKSIETNTHKKDSTGNDNLDSNHVKVDTNTAISKKESTNEINKETKRVPVIGLTLLGLAMLALFLIIRYWNAITDKFKLFV